MREHSEHEVPLLLRGDVLNWLRPECLLRPRVNSVSRRALVALEAVKLGRVHLAEDFLQEVLERLAGKPGQPEIDSIVAELKGAERGIAPEWPYSQVEERLIPLPQQNRCVAVDMATVPGGALVVLLAEVHRDKETGSTRPRWRLVWIDLGSFEVDHVRTFVHSGKGPEGVLLAPGHDDDAPLAVVYGSVLIRFDTAGRTRVTDLPFLRHTGANVRMQAAALDPDSSAVVLAIQEGDTVHVVRLGRRGSVSTIVRYPGQIDRFAVGPGMLVGVGLRDIVCMDLEKGRTSMRDLHPYFADQPVCGRASPVVLADRSILVQEGRKVLRVSRDLRVVETEYLLEDEVDRLLAWDDRLVRVEARRGIGAVRVRVDRRNRVVAP
jgi:hypothetical protein